MRSAAVEPAHGRIPASARPAVLLQRACSCGQHGHGEAECEECKQKKQSLQRAASGAAPALAPAIVHQVLRSPGRPLEPSIRSPMEQRFGRDFSGVAVHTDGHAAASAHAVGARAYTVGSHIVFGASEYAPLSRRGARLLAHELTHVLQQRGARQVPGRLEIGADDDPLEYQAEAAGAAYAGVAPAGGAQQVVRRAAVHTGRILAEGTCEHLACNSKWMCEDATQGIKCPDGTRNAFSKTNKKYRPLFTCDVSCDKGKTCDDNDNWMAIPKSRMARSGKLLLKKCGQDLVICANAKFTHGVVRDRSEIEAWEVSPGILSNLGVTKRRGDITDGAVYSDEADPAFKKDSRCRPTTTAAPVPKQQTQSESAGEAVEDAG